MRTIRVSDEVYEGLARIAARDGVGVDAYLAGIAQEDDLSHRFTPEIVADLERIAGRMRQNGEGIALDEFDRRLAARRGAWIEESGA